jgi:hypothetical protein
LSELSEQDRAALSRQNQAISRAMLGPPSPAPDPTWLTRGRPSSARAQLARILTGVCNMALPDAAELARLAWTGGPVEFYTETSVFITGHRQRRVATGRVLWRAEKVTTGTTIQGKLTRLGRP